MDASARPPGDSGLDAVDGDTSPRVVELRSGTGKNWRLIASVAFFGVLCVPAGVASGIDGDPVGWLVALVGLGFVLLGLLGMRGKTMTLTLEEKTLTIRGFGTQSYRWTEIETFAPRKRFGGSFVAFMLSEAAFMRRRKLTRILTSSRERMIPARTVPADELAALLERYRLAAPPALVEDVSIDVEFQTRFPVVVWALALANVAVFAWQVVDTNDIEPIYGTVFGHGALFAPLVQEGDWWRVLTYGFLHMDPLHIAVNMVILVLIGRHVERLIGSARFAALYLVSLIAGAAGAMLVSPDTIAAGASAGVFGVLLAAIVADARGAMATRGFALALLIVNVVLTFGANVSHGGHVGGAIGGLLAMLALTVPDRARGLALRPLEPAIAALAGLLTTASLLAWYAAGR